MWPTSWAACQKAIEGLEEIHLPLFFFQMIETDTWEPGSSDAGRCRLGRVSGRRDQWEDQRLCLIAQGCRALLSVLSDHCALAWTIFLTFLIHICWGTTAPPYLKQYHGHIPSTAYIAWDAFISWQNGKFSLFPGRPSCLVQTSGRTASFHVSTSFLSLRGTLMHPRERHQALGYCGFLNFLPSSLLQQHRCSHCGIPPEALPSRAARACHPLCQIRRLSFLWTATLKRWGRGQWSFQSASFYLEGSSQDSM